jgi:hypothetical protein
MVRVTGIVAVLGLAMALGCLLPAPALCADPTPLSPSHQGGPQAVPGAGSGSSEPLGDQLDRSNGVIRPPAGVDPGLTQRPPESGGRTPVIPPPGTPGGKRDLNPK